LVADVNDGTKIVSNIKNNNTAEAVVEAEASRRQTLGHCAVNSGARLVETRGQVFKFGASHITVIPD
jgi:hypothetical protein